MWGLQAVQTFTWNPATRGVTSCPHPAESNLCNLSLGRSTGQKPWPAVGQALLPHCTLVIIPVPSADLPGSACQLPYHPQRHRGGDSQCSRLRFLSGTSAGRSRQLPSRRCFVGAQGIAQPSHSARGVVWTLVNNLSMLPEPGDLFPTRCSTVLRAALGSNQLGLNRKLALQHPAPEPLGFRVVHMFLLELVECPALGMIRGPGGPPPPGSTLRCCRGPGPRGSCVGAPATSVALGR